MSLVSGSSLDAGWEHASVRCGSDEGQGAGVPGIGSPIWSEGCIASSPASSPPSSPSPDRSPSPPLGEAPGADVQVSLREGGTEFAVCVIPAVDTSCGAPIPGADPGSRSIDVHLTRDADAVVHSGTLFFVDDAAPSVRLEWRDAAGNWIESPGNAMPLHGNTAARCVVTNEGNAAFEFDSFSGFVGGAVSGRGPVTVPLEATVPAGPPCRSSFGRVPSPG